MAWRGQKEGGCRVQTWVLLSRLRQEVPEMVKEFLKQKHDIARNVKERTAARSRGKHNTQSRLAAQGRSSDVNEGPPSTDKKDIHEHSSDFDVSLAVFNESINVIDHQMRAFQEKFSRQMEKMRAAMLDVGWWL